MARLTEKLGLLALHRLDPERAHTLSLHALRLGLVPLSSPVSSPRLKTSVAGLDLPNPIGLAAGFDKNATAIAPLLRAGFGWIELGAATPHPQPGNPRPRLFRLTRDRAAINRFGFNNEGADAIAKRLAKRPKTGIIGLNLGANKNSPNRVQDYVKVLQTCGPLVDFVTVNVSSPNTLDLRDLQAATALHDLLAGVVRARALLAGKPAIFLKIAPDLGKAELREIAETALKTGIDGIIATNTTLSRKGLTSALKDEAGGLSGTPLFAPSTRILALLSQYIDGAIPLIGVGGIASPEDAYTKIKAGASAVQLYTAMVFQGIGVVNEIVTGLDDLLARDGFDNVAGAVGIERDNYS